MDTILRNARVEDGTDRPLVDIGIEGGRIAAIEPGVRAGGEEIDAGGRLVTPGFVETHIHLDKSCILDRCRSERGDLEEGHRRGRPGQAGVHAGGRLRAREEDAREMHPERHHPHAHPPGGGPGHRPAGPRRRAAPGRGVQVGHRRRDLHLSAGRAAQQPGHRRAHGRGARKGRLGGRRGALYGQRSPRTDRPHLRDGTGVRHRHRHASGFRTRPPRRWTSTTSAR